MNIRPELQNRLHLIIAHVLRLRSNKRKRTSHLYLTISALSHIITAQDGDQSIHLSKIRSNFAASQMNQFVADRSNRFVQRQHALLRVPELHQTDFKPAGERQREFVEQNRHGFAVEKADIAADERKKERKNGESGNWIKWSSLCVSSSACCSALTSFLKGKEREKGEYSMQ